MKFNVGDNVKLKETSKFYGYQSQFSPFIITDVGTRYGYEYSAKSLGDKTFNAGYNEEDLELVSRSKVHSSGGNL